MTFKNCNVRVGLPLCSKYCKMDHQHNVFGTFLFSFYIIKKEHSIENQFLKQINSTFNLGTKFELALLFRIWSSQNTISRSIVCF